MWPTSVRPIMIQRQRDVGFRPQFRVSLSSSPLGALTAGGLFFGLARYCPTVRSGFRRLSNAIGS